VGVAPRRAGSSPGARRDLRGRKGQRGEALGVVRPVLAIRSEIGIAGAPIEVLRNPRPAASARAFSRR